MHLARTGREYYRLAITTDPTVAAWEASFDRGATWISGTLATDDSGDWLWLLAGPDAEPGDATVLTKSVNPLIRGVDNPEIIVRAAPRITLSP